MNTLQVVLGFRTSDRVTMVEINTAEGCAVDVKGPLYPTDIYIINDIVKILRERKDYYPVEKKERGNNEK